MAGAIVAVGLVRVAHRPENRSHISFLHGSLLLLLSFLVLPATSMKIFRVLTPCFKLKTNDTWLHYADLAVNCESARFLNAKTLAFLMIALYPFGVPLCYACLLIHFRRKINPLGCDKLQAIRLRRENILKTPSLRAIDFL